MFLYGGAMKVTFEFKKSPNPEVRWQRIMDIIRRDLEQQSDVRYSQSDLPTTVLPLPTDPLKLSNTELTLISPS